MTYIQLAVFRYVPERTTGWLEKLKEFFEAVPTAAVGEVGIHGRSYILEDQFDLRIFYHELKF